MRWWLLPLAMLAGCDRSEFKDVSVLGDLRVLAMPIDAPEVAPGTTVNVTPFVTDLKGGGRALSYSAEGCVDPGLSVGAELTCAGRPDRLVIATDVALPLAAPDYTGSAPTFAVTIPANILDNQPATVQANGYAYLLFYTVKAADGASVRAFKRIFASTKSPKNTNPVVSAVTGDGAPLGALPTALTKLEVTLTPASFESYPQLDVDGRPVTKNEDPLVSWFVSDGTVDPIQDAVKEAVSWQPPTAAPAGRPVLLVAVVRDRRGGDAVFRYAFP